MDHPKILVLLLTTAAALPHGPTFRGYFDKAFPFQEVAARIASWTPESKSNVWELSGQYEGDIMLHAEQPGSARNILLNEETRWPDAVLPYYIDPVFSEKEKSIIEGALSDFNDNSCVKLVPYKDQDSSKDKTHDSSIIRSHHHDDTTKDYKTFEKKIPAKFIWIQGEETGCWSMVGRQDGKLGLGDPEEEEKDYLDVVDMDDAGKGENRKKRSWLEELGLGFLIGGKEKGPGPGGQVVNLQRPGCIHHGVVVHEVLHALGFFHQQSAHDRDEFVEIVWENISAGKENNFNKYNSSVVTDFGVPYDYVSVMHYGRTAFSKNGNDTIVPKKKDAKIGQRAGMSKGDIAKLIKAYCEEQKETYKRREIK